jgi:DUF1009 family protein
LIAGSGELPLYFARRARQEGFLVKTVALRGAASPQITSLSSNIAWISVGQLGSLISFFRAQGVRRAVMHGKVEHSSAFKNPKLDWKALALWMRLKDRSGEAILKAVAGELLKNGVKLLDGRFLMDDLLMKRGWLTRKKADAAGMESITYGLQKAKVLAKAGVGQTLIVKNKAVAAVEAMEGTNETIRRAGEWAGRGTILVKTSSPRQDWRFDIPTIGVKTIQSMIAAKAKGMVLESGRAFLLEREKTIGLADKNGIFIRGV